MSILLFFCFFCKFFAFFVFGRVGLVFGGFWRGSLFDLWAGLGGFAVAPSVKRGGFGRLGFGSISRGRGGFGLYLLYGAKTSRRGESAGAGLCAVCDSGGVCLSLSACLAIGAGLCPCPCAIGAQRKPSNKCSEQVFESNNHAFFADPVRISNRILTEY